MLFKNLFSIALIASSVFAAPPPHADDSSSSPLSNVTIDNLKAAFYSVREKFAKELEPHLASLKYNPHVIPCGEWYAFRDCTEWLEPSLTAEQQAIAEKINTALKSTLSLQYGDDEDILAYNRVENNFHKIVTPRLIRLVLFSNMVQTPFPSLLPEGAFRYLL